MKNRFTQLTILFFTLLFCNNLCAQIKFQKRFGGTGSDFGSSVQPTSDGGYIIAGMVLDIGAGAYDVALIKTDANGDTIWTRTYGQSNDDGAREVKQTSDGGYIITAFTVGATEIYGLKTDSVGNLLWSKTYGATIGNEGESVIQTADGGFLFSGDASGDFNLIKTNSAGDIDWAKAYSGLGLSRAYSVKLTTDSGYVVTGYADNGGPSHKDFYLLRLNSAGDTLWTRTYGGIGDEQAREVQQITDGGFVIIGKAFSSFGVFTEDIYIVRTDASGNTIWSRVYNYAGDEAALSIDQTSDGGFIIAGETVDMAGINSDALLIKVDTLGQVTWAKTYGGSNWDRAQYVRQATDGGFVFTGYTTSFTNGDGDIYFVKTDANGNRGCNENSQIIQSDTAATIVGSAPFTITTGNFITPQTTSTFAGIPMNTLCTSIGIDENLNNLGLSVYPNPFTSEFILEGSKESGLITLSDITGKKRISQKSNEGETRITPLNLAAGMYILTYEREGKIANLKVVKYE